jgi:hypothetical protein
MSQVNLQTRGCIQKFLDWPSGARIASGKALCHQVQLYRYFMSQSSEFCRHNPLCCFSTCVYCCLFNYRLSSETFGYALLYECNLYTQLYNRVWNSFSKYTKQIHLPHYRKIWSLSSSFFHKISSHTCRDKQNTETERKVRDEDE